MRSFKTFCITFWTSLGAARVVLGAIVVGLIVAACASGPGGGGGYSENEDGLTPTGSGGVKVALLLPITGSGDTPEIAKALRQAGELALFEFNNPNVTLVPKDTKGTPQGAAEAAESAVSENAELIIGPLFADEVRAVAPVASRAGIPVLAFSSDRNVAGNNVYLLSFLAGADVERITSYAIGRGKKNFAALIPESAYGTIAEREFAKTVAGAGGRTVVRATYPTGNSAGMSGPVGRVANAVKAGQQVDAVFLPAGPDELRALGPLLSSNGLTGGKTQLLGTGQWNSPDIGSNSALVGGWYPAPDPSGWNGFAQRYQKTYGSQPPRLASLAYDAVSLAVSLSNNAPGDRYTSQQLTRPTGFAGVDGLFRLLPDGTTERGLAILEVQPSGPRVIDQAPKSFSSRAGIYGNRSYVEN